MIAWQEFEKGKKDRKDVGEFSLMVMKEIFLLHHDLKNKTYRHSQYVAFKINDPRPSAIHKASVRDRLLNHAVYRAIYPYFDK